MTSPTSDRDASALQPVMRHLKLALAITALGTALGLGIALILPVTYTAESRLAVGTGELNSLNIPGYPSASEDMAANYARWVTDRGAADTFDVGDAVDLQASPLPESNVIRVEASSRNPDTAVAAADEAATALQDAVNEVRGADDPAVVLQEVQTNAPAVVVAEDRFNMLRNIYRGILAEFQTGTVAQETLDASRDQYTQAYTEWVTLDTEQTARIARYQRLVSQQTSEADLTLVQNADVSGNDRASNLQKFALAGTVIGGFAALVTAHIVERRRARENVGTEPAVEPSE